MRKARAGPAPAVARTDAVGKGSKKVVARDVYPYADDTDREIARSSAIGAALAIVTLAVYVKTAYPTVPGGDAGELCHMSCALGVAHPPGYPLFIMLGYLFTVLIPVGTPGFRVNCVSCVCGSFAALGMYLFCQRWYASRGVKRSSLLALLPAGLMAFAPLFWQYHVQAEVFSMNNMLVSLQLLLGQAFLDRCNRAMSGGCPTTGTSVDAAKTKTGPAGAAGGSDDVVNAGAADSDEHAEGAERVAIAGAFVIGLGFANQHAIVFFSLPMVFFVLSTDLATIRRINLLCHPPVLTKLIASGLLGLSPYLFLPWSASRAPIGSWGNQRTLEGFFTHLLRREYGTFRLYSGTDAEYSSLAAVVPLFLENLAENTLVVGVPLILCGVFVVLKDWRKDGMGLLLVGAFTFYFVVFHTLANLPLNDRVMVGVQMRFWMQAHLMLLPLVGPGLAAATSFLLGEADGVSSVAPLALVALQAAVSFRVSDQSSNYAFEQYGRSIFASMRNGSIVLSKGDNVVNSMRYLQLCEGERPDLQLVDQSMMSYPWFKITHGPHLSGVELPGAFCSSRQSGKAGGYSMGDFLDVNLRAGGPHVYVCGGWRDEAKDRDGAFWGVEGYRTVPWGVAERVVRESDFYKLKPEKIIKANDVLGVLKPEKKKILDISSQFEKYDERTWELSIHVHSQQAIQRLGHFLVMRAQKGEDDARTHELALKFLLAGVWPASQLSTSALGHRIAAIGCSRLMNKRSATAGHKDTRQQQLPDCSTDFIIQVSVTSCEQHLRRYIQLEAKLPVDQERQIVEAYQSHPFALININLEE